jgi:hypothetical protein
VPPATTANPYSAGASATGYLFQCRYALHLLLERYKQDTDAEVSIEKFDDISFDAHGTPKELIQSKHHSDVTPDLTDFSPDLWKSLRVWSHGVAKKRFSLPQTSLLLVTTAQCAPASAASLLRDNSDRNPGEALRLLLDAAGKMTGMELKSARESFMALPSPTRLQVLESLHVLDQAPDIADTAALIRGNLRLLARPDRLDTFHERLEGWWFGQAILRLSGTVTDPITGTALWLAIDSLVKSFLDDSLPIDHASDKPEGLPELATDNRIFLRQLGLISLAASSFKWARIDFYRAFTQRSRWLKDNLLASEQLVTYDGVLKEEWERRYDRMEEELGGVGDDLALKASGRDLYNYFQDHHRSIRPNCTELFIGRGSYHMLAERKMVGWHRDFQQLLEPPQPTP